MLLISFTKQSPHLPTLSTCSPVWALLNRQQLLSRAPDWCHARVPHQGSQTSGSPVSLQRLMTGNHNLSVQAMLGRQQLESSSLGPCYNWIPVTLGKTKPAVGLCCMGCSSGIATSCCCIGVGPGCGCKASSGASSSRCPVMSLALLTRRKPATSELSVSKQ